MALATTTIAVIGLALTAASTGVALYAQDTQSKQLEANAKFEADQAAADAAAAKGAAEVEAMRIRKQAGRKKSEAIAAMAASGVDVSASASAVKITEDIDKQAGEDAYLTLVGGTDAAARLKQQGQASQIAANAERSGRGMNTAATLLSAAGNANNQYAGWKRAGTGG